MITPSSNTTSDTGDQAPVLFFPKPASSTQQHATTTTPVPESKIEVVEVNTLQQLAPWMNAWQELAKVACEPNVFYEPELLHPAFEQYFEKGLRILLATAKPRGCPKGAPLLCGLMPLVPSSDQKQIRLPSLESWRYPQAFLTTPLIRQDIGVEVLHAYWNHFSNSRNCPLWTTLTCVGADGPFQQILSQFIQESDLPFFVRSMHRRAVFRPCDSSQEYFARWSKVRRHSVTRLSKRLGEQGRLHVASYRAGEPCEDWIKRFLELEERGWKGRIGTALSKSQSDQRFTSEMLHRCAANGKLQLLALQLDDKTIAMKCNITTGTNGFAWKITYDEDYYKFSPGCVLEKENIEMLHHHREIAWMDSCATPNHPMIDSLWPDRRLVQSISIGTNQRGSRLAMSALPLLRWTQQAIRTACAPKRKSPIRQSIKEPSE
jgi:hypothetical protein